MLLAAEARLGASFGQGRGLIFLDNVNCNGTELQLGNCTNRGIGVHYCSHVGDAGVVCRGEFYESTIHRKLSHIIIECIIARKTDELIHKNGRQSILSTINSYIKVYCNYHIQIFEGLNFFSC